MTKAKQGAGIAEAPAAKKGKFEKKLDDDKAQAEQLKEKIKKHM